MYRLPPSEQKWWSSFPFLPSSFTYDASRLPRALPPRLAAATGAALPLDQIVSSSFGLREKEDVYVLLTISKADIDLDHGRMLKQHITKAIDCRDRPNENQFLLCPTSGPLARAPVITAPATTPRRARLACWLGAATDFVSSNGSERERQRAREEGRRETYYYWQTMTDRRTVAGQERGMRRHDST